MGGTRGGEGGRVGGVGGAGGWGRMQHVPSRPVAMLSLVRNAFISGTCQHGVGGGGDGELR